LKIAFSVTLTWASIWSFFCFIILGSTSSCSRNRMVQSEESCVIRLAYICKREI
jgi:hypothetical protein